MATTRKKDFAPHISPDGAPPCNVPGCMEPGTYKAPRSKNQLSEYNWYCLEHVREHNKQWDFFGGMDRDEIEQFMKDSVTGHRPTWSRETNMKKPFASLQEALEDFLSISARRARTRTTSPNLPAKLRKALAVMDMNHPYSAEELKVQYRVLVKKFHPDLHKGDKQFEERFKQITAAYEYLNKQLKTS